MVEMFHPDAGFITCSDHAARVHARNGWEVVAGARTETLPAADGSALTTGTVFAPESFDAAVASDDNNPADQSGDKKPSTVASTTSHKEIK